MVVLQETYNSMNEEPVIIIGAGWAGLAAAIKLTQAGKNVLVLESAKQTGGRARGIKFNSHNVDNGQHILIGAYYECLNLFKTIGIDTATKLKQLPLQLTVIDKNKTALKLTAPKLPAPYHLLYSLLTAKGLSFKDKIAAMRFGLYLKKNNYIFAQDISVSALFIATKQTGRLIKNLWEPLCLATLNTPVHKASANIFMRVFKDAFTLHRKDADTLLPTVNLSELFPVAAVNYIESHGGLVKLKSRVENLIIKNNQITGVEISQGLDTAHIIESSQVIIATAPQNLKKLFSKHQDLKPVSSAIKQLNFEPIVTIYLQYSGNPKLDHNMIGMTGTLSQWVFDRHNFCQQQGLISVVISADGEHMTMDDDTLAKSVHDEISVLFGNNVTLQDYFVIREKRATFACEVNSSTLRPKNITTVTGLYLAGDYTDTSYPATLEGAVRSGITAAKNII